MGQQRKQNPGHPQGEEPNQLADALPSQVNHCTPLTLDSESLLLTCYSPFIRSALMSPKRAPTARPGRDRFTAESYTVLGMNTLLWLLDCVQIYEHMTKKHLAFQLEHKISLLHAINGKRTLTPELTVQESKKKKKREISFSVHFYNLDKC